MLSGNTAANAGLGALTASACTVFQTGNGDLTLAVSKAGVDSVSVFQKKSFSLRPDSANFIRNVFNTNPTIVNDEITTPAAQSASLGGQFWPIDPRASEIDPEDVAHFQDCIDNGSEPL